jgi:glyoxylase I family protein
MPTSDPPVNPTSPLASIRGNHAAIRVPDFDAAIAWYTGKLDFRVTHTWPFGDLKLAYLAPAVDASFTIEVIAGPGATDRVPSTDLTASLTRSGFHHVCFAVASTDDTVAELRRRGITIVAEPFDLPAISRRLAFFSDPWGNLFELTQVLA